MSHHLVGQSLLLNSLTKKYLDDFKPGKAIFLGIAGGNGLEHIDNDITKTVVAIDINQDYLEVAFKRYGHSIASLQLVNLDITKNSDPICKADFIWAALLLEYTGIDNVLEFCRNNIRENGHLIVSIQSNNGISSISHTGIESIKKAGELFSEVNPEELIIKSAEKRFKLFGKEENILPNGKSIITFHFNV